MCLDALLAANRIRPAQINGYRHEEFTHDDQRDHPARRNALADEHHQNREDEDLVRRGIEQRAERRGVAAAARDPAVEPVRGHGGGEEGGGPVIVVLEVPRVEQDDERDRGGARNGQNVRKAH